MGEADEVVESLVEDLVVDDDEGVVEDEVVVDGGGLDVVDVVVEDGGGGDEVVAKANKSSASIPSLMSTRANISTHATTSKAGHCKHTLTSSTT